VFDSARSCHTNVNSVTCEGCERSSFPVFVHASAVIVDINSCVPRYAHRVYLGLQGTSRGNEHRIRTVPQPSIAPVLWLSGHRNNHFIDIHRRHHGASSRSVNMNLDQTGQESQSCASVIRTRRSRAWMLILAEVQVPAQSILERSAQPTDTVRRRVYHGVPGVRFLHHHVARELSCIALKVATAATQFARRVHATGALV
jgi:hypothetical protein